ncbi:MAG: hypothetical protein KJ941_03205 [Bacteroidetes bacterium]|nr:hypothetical protein [Bacteroidota bacterium]
MKQIFNLRIFKVVCIITIFSTVVGCFNRELRGKVIKSKDYGTYLIINEKDNENCTLYVDDRVWPVEVGQKGKITPGNHKLKCGGTVEITIKKGTTFSFDYWGP